jgi:hypothetical protein
MNAALMTPLFRSWDRNKFRSIGQHLLRHDAKALKTASYIFYSEK